MDTFLLVVLVIMGIVTIENILETHQSIKKAKDEREAYREIALLMSIWIGRASGTTIKLEPLEWEKAIGLLNEIHFAVGLPSEQERIGDET